MKEIIQKLRTNVIEEKKILERISSLQNQRHDLEIRGLNKEKENLDRTIKSLENQLKIVNNSIPKIVKEITLAKKIPKAPSKKKNKEEAEVIKEGKVFLIKGDKERFLKELKISEDSLKQVKKERRVVEQESIKEFKKASFYGKISNRLFLNISNRLIGRGIFDKLKLDLKKANFTVLLTTYISMMLLSVVLSIFLGLLIWIILIFFPISFETPFISMRAEGFLMAIIENFAFVIALPLLTFVSFYFYPSAEKKSIAKKIERELPFAAIHMSAIASSGVEPSEIFRIIALSKDYVQTGLEAKKIMNQINLYGYDLVNALQNISRATPSKRLSELLNGLGTTINTGGSLTDFLDKRSESLLFEYKIEREKYTRTAETFMDIYISVAIAAPMLMMLLLVMIVVTGLGLGMGINSLTLLIISIVIVINIVFLGFLHLKQPGF